MRNAPTMNVDIHYQHLPSCKKVQIQPLTIAGVKFLHDNCIREGTGYEHYGGVFHVPLEKVDSLIEKCKQENIIVAKVVNY